jgi:hypothetical protein
MPLIKDIKQKVATFGITIAGIDTELNDNEFVNDKIKFKFIHEDCKNSSIKTLTNFKNLFYKCDTCPKNKLAKYFDSNAYITKRYSRDKTKTKEEHMIELQKEIDILKNTDNKEIIKPKGGPGAKYSLSEVINLFNERGFDVIDKEYKGYHIPLNVMHKQCNKESKISIAELKRWPENKTCETCDNFKLKAKFKKQSVKITAKDYIEKLDSRKSKITQDENKEDIKTDIKKDEKQDIKTDIKKDEKQDIKTDIKKDEKQDIKRKITKQEIKKDEKQDIKTEIKKDEKQDIKTEIKKDEKQDIKRKRTRQEILQEIINLGYVINGEYTNDTDKLLFIHKCSYKEEMSWGQLKKRIDKNNEYCEGCTKFRSKSKSFNLEKTLKNVEDIEKKFNMVCINKESITKKKFDYIFKCNNCSTEKQGKFVKRLFRGCQYCFPIKSYGELLCKTFLELIFDKKFVSVRPEFLRNITTYKLELDCYCEELKLALEFQGIQHFIYDKHLHKGDINEFKKQQERDIFKKQKCFENKVNLIEITYLDEKKGKDYIKQKIVDELLKLGYDINNLDEKLKQDIKIQGGNEICVNLKQKIANKLKELNYRFLFSYDDKYKQTDQTIIVCNYNHHFITTYDNFGNKSSKCPYCSKKKFTDTYLNHNAYIRGWPIKFTNIIYNEYHPKKSFVEYKCKRCNNDHSCFMNDFKKILIDNKYPCQSNCIPANPPEINTQIYNIIFNYLKKIKSVNK